MNMTALNRCFEKFSLNNSQYMQLDNKIIHRIIIIIIIYFIFSIFFPLYIYIII